MRPPPSSRGSSTVLSSEVRSTRCSKGASRSTAARLVAGDLFVAIEGPASRRARLRRRGSRRGAPEFVVSKTRRRSSDAGVSGLRVDDTTRALQDLAAAVRERAALASSRSREAWARRRRRTRRGGDWAPVTAVLKTEGNLNNHYGLPLTLLKLADEDVAVLEMGMSARRDSAAHRDRATRRGRSDQRRRGAPRVLRLGSRNRRGEGRALRWARSGRRRRGRQRGRPARARAGARVLGQDRLCYGIRRRGRATGARRSRRRREGVRFTAEREGESVGVDSRLSGAPQRVQPARGARRRTRARRAAREAARASRASRLRAIEASVSSSVPRAVVIDETYNAESPRRGRVLARSRASAGLRGASRCSATCWSSARRAGRCTEPRVAHAAGHELDLLVGVGRARSRRSSRARATRGCRRIVSCRGGRRRARAVLSRRSCARATSFSSRRPAASGSSAPSSRGCAAGEGELMLYHLLYPLHAEYSASSTSFATSRFAPLRRRSPRSLISFVLGPWLIARLRQFQIGQHIRQEGPATHRSKAGTPTMGGLLILTAIVVPTLLWANLTNVFVWVALATTVAFGLIGFADDYLKIVRKQSLGLSARAKFMLSRRRSRARRRSRCSTICRGTGTTATVLLFPFFKAVRPDLGWLYRPVRDARDRRARRTR